MSKQTTAQKHRFEWILLALTLAVCAFTVGYYFGRNTSRPLQAQTAGAAIYVERGALPSGELPMQKDPDMAEAALPQAGGPQEDRLDLNTATAEELTDLPGIGEELAQRIVAYREEYGAFVSVEELTQVRGIGEKKLEALRDLVKVEEKNEDTGS